MKLKRIVAIGLTALLVAGCGTKAGSEAKSQASNETKVQETSKNPKTTADNGVKPKDFAYVLRVTINPELDLYVGYDNKVVYSEAVNDDAKALLSNVSLLGLEIGEAVDNLTDEAAKEGFLTKPDQVRYEIMESNITKDEENGVLAEVRKVVDTAGFLMSIPVPSANDWEKYAPEKYDMVLSITQAVSYLLYYNANDDVFVKSVPIDNKNIDDYSAVIIDGRPSADGFSDMISVPVLNGHLKSGQKITVDVIKSHIGRDNTENVLEKFKSTLEAKAKDNKITVSVTTDLSKASIDATNEDYLGKQDGNEAQTRSNNEQPVEQHNEQPTEQQTQGGGVLDEREGYHKCTACGTTGVCDRCGGSGKMVDEGCDHGYRFCYQCNGEGKMKCNCGDGKCWNCHGEEYFACTECDGTNADCPACHGTGKIHCNSCEHGECSQCGGTLYTGICTNCNGEGKILCESCGGTGMCPCVACKGSGVCIWCNGIGYVKND